MTRYVVPVTDNISSNAPWSCRGHGLRMPKEMINFTLDRKAGEPWGFVIVGGKDQVRQDLLLMKSNHSPGPYCQAGPYQSLL